MNDLEDLNGLREDMPAFSPLARSRARVKLLNHAEAERPAPRRHLFRRPTVHIAATAGIAAAAVAGVGIFAGSGTPAARPASAAPHTTAVTPVDVHVKQAAWSVDTLKSGDVELSMASHSTEGFDAKPLTFAKTLKRAGVPATTRIGVTCEPGDLSLQKRVVTFNIRLHHSPSYTIHTKEMPADSQIVIGYQSWPMGGLTWSVTVETAGHPLQCATPPAPHWTPQPGWTAPTTDPAHNSKFADGPMAR